ncbi:MAG: hypothetical protein GY863_08765, partial [bacterium]|nr:hypothetical protein [bacterium]
MKELALLIIVVVLMQFILLAPDDVAVFPDAELTFGFGFLLVSAYIFGLFFSRIKLPKISGYMIAGIVFGPFALDFFSADTISNMSVINQLALTFIALNAGGELHLKEISAQKSRILWLIALLITFIFTGMFTFILVFKPYIPFVKDLPGKETLVVAALIGTISIARSPSSIIAIMQECKAHGPYSEVVLGVTVAIDFIVILIFAIVVSLCEAALSPMQNFDIMFFFGVAVEVVCSVVSGIVLGAGVSYYIKKVKVNLPILLIILAFLIYNISSFISQSITQYLDIRFHLEPLLVAITAGFYIQNFTKEGPRFLGSIERSALPIYVLFFAMAGMVIDMNILKDMVVIGVVIVVVRASMALLSGMTAGKLSRAPRSHGRLYG